VHALDSLVAQYALYVVAVIAVAIWAMAPRPEKVALAFEMVVGLVAVALLVRIAGALHDDPRPFVVNPSLHPWFSHPADNLFPSDHTAVAAATSLVVLRRRRTTGLALLALTVLIGVSRVLAHVHHIQDVVAGLVIGLLSATAGLLAWRGLRSTTWARRASGLSHRETTSRGAGGRP
jgi:membrane-associated phospholipid phosphatase